MFARSDVFKGALRSMDVPIFEDVRLSRRMQRTGKVVIPSKKVVTSWDAFRLKGVLGHLWTIVRCNY